MQPPPLLVQLAQLLLLHRILLLLLSLRSERRRVTRSIRILIHRVVKVDALTAIVLPLISAHDGDERGQRLSLISEPIANVLKNLLQL